MTYAYRLFTYTRGVLIDSAPFTICPFTSFLTHSNGTTSADFEALDFHSTSPTLRRSWIFHSVYFSIFPLSVFPPSTFDFHFTFTSYSFVFPTLCSLVIVSYSLYLLFSIFTLYFWFNTLLTTFRLFVLFLSFPSSTVHRLSFAFHFSILRSEFFSFIAFQLHTSN